MRAHKILRRRLGVSILLIAGILTVLSACGRTAGSDGSAKSFENSSVAASSEKNTDGKTPENSDPNVSETSKPSETSDTADQTSANSAGTLPSSWLTPLGFSTADGVLFGYADSSNNFVIKPVYKQANVFHPDGLALVSNDKEKSGLINLKGDVVVPLEYDLITGPKEGIYLAKQYGEEYDVHAGRFPLRCGLFRLISLSSTFFLLNQFPTMSKNVH